MPFYLEIYIYIKIIVHFYITFLYVLMLSLIFNCKVIFFATGYMNRLTYLYQNGNYWSMSPSHFDVSASSARGFHQYAAGIADGYGNVTSGRGLRPVINLQSDKT